MPSTNPAALGPSPLPLATVPLTVFDVEQHALRAFEQDAAALAALVAQPHPHRLGVLLHERGNLAQLCEQRGAVDGRLVEAGPQRVVVGTEAIEHRLELVQVGKVAHPDRPATDLVLIRGADTAAGGADLALARGGLAPDIELAVQREDQRTVVGDGEIVRRDGHALPFEPLDLGLERPGIEHHAVADDRQRAGDDARRKHRQLVGGVADHQRVPGVMPALEAHHHVGAAGEPVDDLAFALIAPLGADHGDIGQGLRFLRGKPARP
jgi:hypothetical protein